MGTTYDDVPRVHPVRGKVGVGFDALLLYVTCRLLFFRLTLHVEVDIEGNVMDSLEIVVVATSEPFSCRSETRKILSSPRGTVWKSRFCAVCNQAHQYQLFLKPQANFSNPFTSRVEATQTEFPSRTALFWCPYPRVE